MNRNGILAAGNWIIDIVKMIDSYPEQDSLSNILSQSMSNGGSPYNILKDLSKLEANFPLEAAGLVGNDENGRFIFEDCKKSKINTSLLQKTDFASTSYTDVMTVANTGRRTFFHQRGANALLSENHILLEKSNAKIFHLGYMLLLDKLDEIKENRLTGASELFINAKKHGFITSADLVSENSDRFQSVINPSLPYLDYLFVNEFELSKLSGIELVINKEVSKENAKLAITKILALGVQKAVVLHFPKGAIVGLKNGEFQFKNSLSIPQEKIKGSVGAGDAFASGYLLGIHENWSVEQSLDLAVCAAASCLFHQSCSEGVLPYEKALELKLLYPFNT